MASVNRPTDVRVKEADVNRKLQLYGIYSAFANGKVPSNKQIDVALNSALQSKYLSSPTPKLSDEGQKLVADLKEVITQAKYLILSKNEGNLLQDFIWQTQHLDGGSAKLPGAPTDKATVQQHGNEALDGLRTLGTLIISNGQFRKLLNDATILVRHMAGDAAQSAANRVNPSEDQLRQIDEPAEDNTWHDVPDMSRSNVKSQIKAQYDRQKPFSRADVQNATENAINTGMDTAQNAPTSDDTTPGNLDGQAGARAGAQTGADQLKAQASENVPGEAKQQAEQTKQRASQLGQMSKNYLSKKMPQERREQTLWRLRKMVAEIQGHSDYQQAIETLLSLAETYGGHARRVGADSAGTVKGAHTDTSLQAAEADLKSLIERFANSTSTDELFESISNIYRDADRDPELRHWFEDLDKFVRRCLQEQGFVLEDSSTEEWNCIYDKGHFLLRERYRDHTNRILDEFKFLGDQFDHDPQNKALGMSLQKLFQDLGTGENGKAKFKPHLVKDLTNVIIPGIFENARYLPIPRIEVSDPTIDAVVENLVIESDNLFPNVLEFGNDNYYRLGRRQVSNKIENKVMIAGSGIQMDLRDVAYYVKKKQGFPSLTDKGVMDIFLAGDGFSFKLAARNAQKADRTHFVVVDNVSVNVKNLSIKIKQSNHKLLFRIAKPLLLKVMRPVIQKAIEKEIRNNFEKLDAFLYDIHRDAQRAAKAVQNDPDNAPSIFQQYLSAYQQKMTSKKEKAKEKVSNTQVHMAVTKQDSIFQTISLPGGISTKATEFKELAAKGDKWESPVFGLGSAQESTDIPRLAPITRKPHSTAAGTVRGGNHPTSATNTSAFDSNASTTATSGKFGANSGTTSMNGSDMGTSRFSNQVDQAFEYTKDITGASHPATNGVSTSHHDNVTQY